MRLHSKALTLYDFSTMIKRLYQGHVFSKNGIFKITAFAVQNDFGSDEFGG